MKSSRAVLADLQLLHFPLESSPAFAEIFRAVYLTEMANELDQHLASRLTSTRTMWVVLDPSKADSILTDSLDYSFWNWLTRN